MTQSEGVRVSIAGQPYPFGSMDGVLLYANEQYEVLLEQASDGSSSSSTTVVRVITVRLGPGETRVLLANLGSGTAPTPPQRARRDRTSRSRESDDVDDVEDDEEIGYLGVSSSPQGSVYVDDQIAGTTPARRIELAPGRHEVRIFYQAEERFSETKNVLIREGVNTNVFFRMSRDEEE